MASYFRSARPCPSTVFYFLLFPSSHRHFPCGTALDGRLGWEPWLGSPSQGSGLHSAQTPAEASASQEMVRFPWVTFRRGHRRPARDQGNNRQRRLSFLIPPSCRIFTNKDEVVVFGMSKKMHQRHKSSQFIVTCENTYMLNHKLGCQNSFFSFTLRYFNNCSVVRVIDIGHSVQSMLFLWCPVTGADRVQSVEYQLSS